MAKSKPQAGWVLIAIVATWRITCILHREGILTPFRRWIGVIDDGYSDQGEWEYPDTFFGRLFQCFGCLSVWVGGFVWLLYLICPPLLLIPLFSAVAIWLEDIYDVVFYE